MRTSRLALLSALVLQASCQRSPREKPELVIAAPSPIDAAVPLASSLDATPPLATSPPVKPECESPCRRLFDTPFAEAAAAVKQECDIDWNTEFVGRCRHWNTLPECIYAAGGKVFKDHFDQKMYLSYSWYSPKPSFSEKDLSSVAKANIKYAKEQRKVCSETQDTKVGEPVKEMEIDFDGDGKAEKIRVTTSRVFVDGVPFVHRLKPPEPLTMVIKVVDLDTRDSYKELMVANYYYGELASRRIFYKRKKEVSMSEKLIWHDITLTWDGKGKVLLKSVDCGQVLKEVYGFKKGEFALLKKKVKGRFEELYCSAY